MKQALLFFTFYLDVHTEVYLKVAPKRWKVDVNGRQDAILMLSSISLPGGIQVS